MHTRISYTLIKSVSILRKFGVCIIHCHRDYFVSRNVGKSLLRMQEFMQNVINFNLN